MCGALLMLDVLFVCVHHRPPPSHARSGHTTTWDDVVRAVVAMVESEVEHIQSSKRKAAKPPALRKDVLDALKNALKIAEQRTSVSS